MSATASASIPSAAKLVCLHTAFTELFRVTLSAKASSLTGRNRYDRCTLLFSRVGELEEKHDKSKQSLRGEVFVVDPVPVLTIRHGGKGIVGFLRRAENPDKSRHGSTVH